jgi:hypothetical protein
LVPSVWFPCLYYSQQKYFVNPLDKSNYVSYIYTMETTAATNPSSQAFVEPIGTREDRGRLLAQRGGIRQLGSLYVVPSQTQGAEAPTYVVDPVDQTCTCPDYETRRSRCKHQEAVWFWLAWGCTVGTVNDAASTPKRKTYPQNWTAYNAAQTSEKAQVELLLQSLCAGLEEPVQTRGRPRIPLRDAVFASVMKVYTTFSGRRATTDIRDCADNGFIADAPHYNSIFRTLGDEATTEVLTRLVEESAAPLAEIENQAGQFAQDSTGFSTVTYDRWFAWVKLHVMIGTVTNVVTGVKVSSEGDCPVLPELLKTTAKRFNVREVSADKAYLSKRNLAEIDAIGAVPFIPFKINSAGAVSSSPHWRRMWAHFSLRTEEFLEHYHRRSNVETTMWMIKSKFGSAVRAKSPTAQVNEVLCKVLCHNLACIVHAIAEFGIDMDLKPAAPKLSLVS